MKRSWLPPCSLFNRSRASLLRLSPVLLLAAALLALTVLFVRDAPPASAQEEPLPPEIILSASRVPSQPNTVVIDVRLRDPARHDYLIVHVTPSTESTGQVRNRANPSPFDDFHMWPAQSDGQNTMSIFTFYEGDIYPENGSKPGRIYVAPLDNAANGETIVITATTSSSGPDFRSNQVIISAQRPAATQESSATLNAIGVRWDNSATGEFDSYTDGRRASYGYRAIVPGTATRVKLIPAATHADAAVEIGKVAYVNGVKQVTLSPVARGSATPAIALNSAGNTLFEVKVSRGGYVNIYTVSIQRSGAATGDKSGATGEPRQDQPQTPQESYAALIAQMYQWRNDPQWSSYQSHTDRWDRALLAFGETVADTTLTAMPASEAQGYADSGMTRWVEVAKALNEIEAAGQPQESTNQAPTVSAALPDTTIVNHRGRQYVRSRQDVLLLGVFNDADNDALTVTAASSDEAVATVWVVSSYSWMRIYAHARGTATITVTANDGKGGTVQDVFTVRVKAAPVVASAIADMRLAVGTTQDGSLTEVFSDADGDALTITAISSDYDTATVSVASDGSNLTVAGVAEGTATITVRARDSDRNVVSDDFTVSVTAPQPEQEEEDQHQYADLIAQMKEWRNDPQWSSYQSHTDRWDRALLAFGETVADTTLTAMPASEAQGYADSGMTRWVEVAKALKEIEAATQQPTTPNRAPTVASAISDATIVNERSTYSVTLAGVFADADSDSPTVTAASSNNAVATVSVASDYSSLTVTARSRGTATITVTASDGNGGTVSDTFTVRVKAAPVVASAIADVSGLGAGSSQDVSLSGVFSDADGDALTITAASSDDAEATVSVASDQSKLTVAGVDAGAATITVTARDADGNRVSDAFDVSVVKAPPNQSPTVSSAIADATIVHERGTHSVSLTGVFRDADADALTVTAASSNNAVATASVASDYSGLTVTAKSRGTATITVTASDGNGGTVSDTFTVRVKAAPVVASAISDLSLEFEALRDLSVSGVFSDADGDALTITASSSDEDAVAALLFHGTLTIIAIAEGTETVTVTAEDSDGNTVSDAFEVTVTAPQPPQQQQQGTPNSAPTVSASIADATIVNQSGTKRVSLVGVFSDADSDALSVTAASSDDAKATVTVASDYSSLTVAAKARGVATITVTASDGNGGAVSDTFTVRVKAAPVVASAISDISGLEVGASREVSLPGVFRDPDGDALTFTAVSSDEDVAAAFEFRGTLTIVGASAGSATITVTARDADGNTGSDAFDVTVAAQQSEPEPTDIVARYDANGDGAIDLSEYRQAVDDYSAGKISYEEMLKVVSAYSTS